MTEQFPVRWDIAEEHLEEAAFLWAQWEASLLAPDYTLDEVCRGPEGRLLAHVDALVLGGTAVAHRLLRPALEDEREDRVFASALALLMTGDSTWHDAVLDALKRGQPHQRTAIQRALMLVPHADFARRLPALLLEASPAVQAALLQVMASHRLDPALPLDSIAARGGPDVLLAALRVARSFPNRLESKTLKEALDSPEPAVQLAALESGLMLGIPEAWATCEQILARRTRAWAHTALLAALGGDARDTPVLLEALVECPRSFWT